MTPEVIMWVFGVIAAILMASFGAGIKSHVNLTERVTRLEAVMSLFGEKAAKILHSPHDPYGIDNLLDKYLDRNYELSFTEWEGLLIACDIIVNDTSKSKDERTLAAWISAVASHKLHKPPPPHRISASH